METVEKKNLLLPPPPSPSVEEDTYDLFSELAQQTDKRTTGLQLLIEKQERAAEDREKRRWTWFYIVVLSIFIAVSVLGFETWERHYDRLSVVEKLLIKVEESFNNIKDIMVKKHEMSDALNEQEKELRKEIRRVITDHKKEASPKK